MSKLTLEALRKLITETIEEVKQEELDEAHHDEVDETHYEGDMKEDDVDEADVKVGVMADEGEKHLEESAQLNRWRKLAGILKD